jgi:Predicted membrane protein
MKIKDIPKKVEKFWKFITVDMWRISSYDLSKKKRRGYNVLKIVYLAAKRFKEDDLQRTASALTYSTFLSLIPLLAVILSIAKGFGFDNIMQSQLMQYFPGQREFLDKAFSFVDSYMAHTKGGLFLGLGIILLIYTVYNLLSTVESAMNSIWQVQKGRTIGRKLTDYMSILILLPILLFFSSGLSIFMTTAYDTISDFTFLAPVYKVLINILPFIFSVMTFTLLYKFMPNTKVKFKYAFFAAIFASIGFLVFQYLYVNGQIWVSKYNAIYGSFAFIPLLLLWLQLSWVICLIGTQLTYLEQNIETFDFETESKNITHRYYDFLILTIVTLIIKRFAECQPAFTASEIAKHTKIPIRLTTHILYRLVDLGILNEVKDEDEFPNYQPAIDINHITVKFLFNKLDCSGSENFKVDNEEEFRKEWDVIIQSRQAAYDEYKDVLIKDL